MGEHKTYYIASCLFTAKYPQLSVKIQSYVRDRLGCEIVRCCVPKFSTRFYEDKMPSDYRSTWSGMPDCADFAPGDTVYSLCHNCSAILEESKPGVAIPSLWELLASDESFPFPDYGGARMVIQDCWRAYDRRDEQLAVRRLLEHMNIKAVELEENFEKTNFCGNSLYRPTSPRNQTLAPRRFVEQAQGKFQNHTMEEQTALMEAYCGALPPLPVVCYCHYCEEGLALGGADVRHLAKLLFDPENTLL